MSRAPLEHLDQNRQSQGASLRPARLGGVEGRGTLQVLRDGSGAKVSVEGTWRPDDADAPLGPLLRAAADGDLVAFEGHLDDPVRPEADSIEVEVKVRSHGVYRFDSGTDAGFVKAGEERHIFNFEPAHEEDAATA